MSGKSIQLPFGVIRDNSKEKSIKLKFPNYRNNALFDHLPYLGHLENPTIKDALRDGTIDNIALQKYLSATGPSKDRIQNSLDMIITDGKLKNAGIRRALDTKYLTVMKKPNPKEVAFKDKTKFDTQNPAIGKLLSQIQLIKTIKYCKNN